jgi:hypothetical protein
VGEQSSLRSRVTSSSPIFVLREESQRTKSALHSSLRTAASRTGSNVASCSGYGKKTSYRGPAAEPVWRGSAHPLMPIGRGTWSSGTGLSFSLPIRPYSPEVDPGTYSGLGEERKELNADVVEAQCRSHAPSHACSEFAHGVLNVLKVSFSRPTTSFFFSCHGHSRSVGGLPHHRSAGYVIRCVPI